VLEFELAQGVKKIDRTCLSDLARSALHDAVPRLFIMTRESTEVLLQANGKTRADCTGECEVEIGRKLGADYIISGCIAQFGTRIAVTMRLFSTVDGQLLSSSEARGATLNQLQEAMDGALAKLLSPLIPPAPTPALTAARRGRRTQERRW
jgi:TolB-like protein